VGGRDRDIGCSKLYQKLHNLSGIIVLLLHKIVVHFGRCIISHQIHSIMIVLFEFS
jgi:hypothetical protein